MNQNQTSPKPTDAEQPSGKGLDVTTCSPSLGELPTPYPGGAWDRTDYVREYAKRVQDLEEIRNVLSTLLEATDRYGMAASMTHPRLTRALSAARKLLPENAESTRAENRP